MRSMVLEIVRPLAAVVACGVQGVAFLRAFWPSLNTRVYWGGSEEAEVAIIVGLMGMGVALGFVGMRAKDRVFRWMGLFAVAMPWVLVGTWALGKLLSVR